MKKRILFLSDVDSSHTRKWAVSLSERGYQIGIFSLKKSEVNWFEKFPAIEVFDADGFDNEKFHESTTSKISYFKLIPNLKKTIQNFQPDIVHAHYATSYGLLGACSGFHPLIISVWGSDVFDFPKKSIIHRLFLFNNLKKADAIFSTSEVMKKETQQYVIAEIAVTPFGVDVNVFCRKAIEPIFDRGTKVVGIIKTLEKKYGIDILLKAFTLVKKEFLHQPLKLLIAGSGTMESEYRQLSNELGIADDTLFTGHLNHDKVSEYHNHIDIFVSPSILDSESFGVSVVEAMACERPVVASSVAGLKEVVENSTTGILVQPGNVEETAKAILKLLNNPVVAQKMGRAGRERVLKLYDWKKNLDHIENLYSKILEKKY